MLFAKVDPMHSDSRVGNSIHCRANVRLSKEPSSCDEIAIWTSESHGGQGLHALGIIESCNTEQFPNARGEGVHDEYVICVRITALVSQPITKADLEKFRGVQDGSPMSALDKGGYSQAHRKINPVDERLARFVRSKFL